MRLRDVNKLVVGDHIELKHNLGSGMILEVQFEPDKDDAFQGIGHYPMIKYRDPLLDKDKYCTYRAIESYHLPRT